MRAIKSKLLFAMVCMCVTSCGIAKKAAIKPSRTVVMTCSATPETRFNDLSNGLSLTVTSDIDTESIYDGSEIESGKAVNYRFSPTINEFVDETMSTFIRSSGISLGRDPLNDYNLKVRVRNFKFIDGRRDTRAIVELSYTLTNPDNEVVLQQTSRGRYTLNGRDAAECIDRAYSRALKAMDWVGIAGALKVHRRPDQEKQRQVKGDGNTALEHTVIRWYIVSAPAGADVSWRVVSSTPDVKNTNSTYVGTTPYETTESFDIRGLKFENSGNVQIEVTCEKPGYVPQRRRFNLRQAIEQREISAKFNLIKDE